MHSVHVAECTFQPGAGVPDPQAHGGGLVLCADDNIGVTVDGKVVVGRRLHHRAGVHKASPIRPGQPSLASVGGGMAAGAASRTLQCANLGAVRSC